MQALRAIQATIHTKTTACQLFGVALYNAILPNTQMFVPVTTSSSELLCMRPHHSLMHNQIALLARRILKTLKHIPILKQVPNFTKCRPNCQVKCSSEQKPAYQTSLPSWKELHLHSRKIRKGRIALSYTQSHWFTKT